MRKDGEESTVQKEAMSLGAEAAFLFPAGDLSEATWWWHAGSILLEERLTQSTLCRPAIRVRGMRGV